MTDEKAAELRRLAVEATAGPWFVGYWGGRCLLDHKHGTPACQFTHARTDGWSAEGTNIAADAVGRLVVRNGYDGAEIDEPDARFIAAANPATVLDLLNELAALKPRPVRESYSCKVCGRRLLDAIPCEDHPMMPVVSSLPDAATLTAWLDHEQQESKALATALRTANERWARAEKERDDWMECAEDEGAEKNRAEDRAMRAEKERDALKAEVARLRFELTGEDEE